jgi:hypothetical protein
MRSILLIIVTLGLILGAGFFTISEVSGTSKVLLSHCDGIKTGVRDGEWEKALEHLKRFEDFWNGVKPLWEILIDHTEIDNIDMALAKIEQYIKTGEKGLALGELSSLELLIRHIPDKEKLSLENIF